MSDSISTDVQASVLSYLRRPRFAADDKRPPAKAVLHALPAFAFLSFNLWLFAMGTAYVAALALRFGTGALSVLLTLVAVPCVLGSWALFVRSVEVEAKLDI